MFSGWVFQAIIGVNLFIIGIVVTLAVQHFSAHRKSKKQTNVDIEVLPKDVRDDIIDNARKQYQRAVYKSAITLDKNLATTTERLNKSLTALRDSVTAGETEQYNEALSTIRNHAANIVDSTLKEISDHQMELRKQFEAHQATLDKELDKEAGQTEADIEKYRQDSTRRQAELEEQFDEHRKTLEQALAKREKSLIEAESQLESTMLQSQQNLATRQQQIETKLQESIEIRRQQLANKLETELADTVLAFLTDALGTDVDLGAQAASLTKLLDMHKDELLKGIKK